MISIKHGFQKTLEEVRCVLLVPHSIGQITNVFQNHAVFSKNLVYTP